MSARGLLADGQGQGILAHDSAGGNPPEHRMEYCGNHPATQISHCCYDNKHTLLYQCCCLVLLLIEGEGVSAGWGIVQDAADRLRVDH